MTETTYTIHYHGHVYETNNAEWAELYATHGARVTAETTGGWDPQPASLRADEPSDVSSHAAGNIAQIREAEREGLLTEEDAETAIERIRGRDER